MRTSLRVILALALSAPLIVTLPAVPAHADSVTSMDDPLFQRLNPGTGATLVTPWSDEAKTAASQYGYTTDLGSPFTASNVSASGLTAVHRLWNASTIDFTDALAGSSAFTKARSAGYVDQGVRYYALSSAVSGRTQPINSYVKNGKHRLATAETGKTLTSSGWTLDGVAFYAPATSAAPAPAPAPTTPAPAPAPAPADPPTTSGSAGSVAIGSADYGAPSSAIYVSTGGNDSNSGTAGSPVKTINRGVALAPTGGTVVVRGGVYRESVTISKQVTLQNYPKEAVWMDGSTPVTGWVADGSTWRKDGWTTRFDHSPTYTQGAPDSSQPYWQFVNQSTYPMAAHPDQVFVNGSPLQQVKSKSLVKDGTFYLDEGSSKLYLGSNPAGKAVDASNTIKALSIRAANTVVRGIGIRRYSPSVFHMAAVTVEQPGVRLENVVIADSATTGLSIQRENAQLNQVTISGSGMLGIHGRYADNLKITRVLATKNNDEHFNIAPVSGGLKIGMSRGVSVSDSSFSGNFGHGFWEDMSVYNSVFRQSDFSDNVGTGLFLEISAKVIVGDNTFARNKEFGIKVNNTSNVQVWNNTFVGNGRPLNIVQDDRRNTNPSDQAVDKRISWPDPEMPWTLGPVTIKNNVVADSTTDANCMLCVEDYSKKKSAEQMGIVANGNVYGRPSASRPTWLVVWSKGAGNPGVYTTLSAFKSATGQESRGREYVGASIVDSKLSLTSSVKSAAADIAEALPSNVATAIGQPAGSRTLGHW
ncbi:MAG: right-handed parallel beta-helix repeat-containing protein [Micropruina sp.]|uniref:right-handed parallel beta-helix repeat-containing protein n=1 Tax=Micropruina sp. TaxID=2737536 RepID=UPI0039E35440